MHRKCHSLLSHAFAALFLTFLIIGTISSAVRAQEKDTLWIEKWDASWEDRWYVDFGTWEVGMPTSGPDTTHEGNMCAATKLAGDYTEDQHTRLIRYIPFTVPAASEHPVLRFWHWYSFGKNDAGYVQVRVVGQTNWTTLPSGWYAAAGSAGYHSSNRWTRPLFDLSAYAGQTVEFCFYFSSSSYNGTYVGPGWYIDEITVETGERVLPNPENWESGLVPFSLTLC